MQRRERWQRRIAARLTLAEAGIYLLSARLLLALLPFPWLMRFLARPTWRAEVEGAKRLQKRKDVRNAIFAQRRLGGQTTCLHRAIAAQVMLRRRGVGTTLYFGAAKLPDQGLTTHAWVQDGDEGVIGFRVAQRDRYYVVASYPRSEITTIFNQQSGDGYGQAAGDSNQ